MNQTHDIGLTVTELRARRSTLDGLDIPTKAEMQLLGVRFTASNAVPPGELWVIALTEDGDRATLVYNVAVG
jgi:hypothetical protein